MLGRKDHLNPHKDFRVRLAALQWLVENNKYYHDVTIDHSMLAALPCDGKLSGFNTIRLSDSEVDVSDESSVSHIRSTFVPVPATGMTEQETIYQSIVQPSRNSATPVNWPSISGNPVNEFTTEGYMSCAFPTLCPTGSADFVSPCQCSVTIGNYFKHLMLYSDSRFAKHPRFRYHFAHLHTQCSRPTVARASSSNGHRGK